MIYDCFLPEMWYKTANCEGSKSQITIITCSKTRHLG